MANINSSVWTTVGSYSSAKLLAWVEAWVVSQDITANTSVIEYRVTAQAGNSQISASSVTISGTGINTSLGYTRLTSQWSTLATWRITVSHSADGTFSQWTDISISSTYGPFSAHMSGWATLPTIPRASSFSISPSTIIPDGSNHIDIYVSRASSSFQHTLTYTFGDYSATIASFSSNDHIVFTPPKELMKYYANSTYSWGTIYLQTWSNGTAIGNQKTEWFYLSSDAAASGPTLSDFLIEEVGKGRKEEADSVYKSLSTKRIKVKAEAKDYATIKSVMITNGSNNVSATLDNGYYTADINNLQTGDFKIVATDTRGYTAEMSHSSQFYDYYPPIITYKDISRENPTSNNGTLKLAVKWYNQQNNELGILIKRSDLKDPIEIDVTDLSKPEYRANPIQFNDLDYTKQYTFTISAIDAFGGKTETTLHISSSEYAMWIGRNTVRMPMLHVFKRDGAPTGIYNEGDMVVKGDLYANIGSLFMTKTFTMSTGSLAAQDSRSINIPLETPPGYQFVSLLNSSVYGDTSHVFTILRIDRSTDKTASVYVGNTWSNWTWPGGTIGVTALYVRSI